MTQRRIAIIGAGISGLVLARSLRDVAEVVVFEKARGVGGRMSTRYADPFYFDHGTQFFTARTSAFQAFLAPYIAQGVVAEWRGKVINLEIGRKISKRLWFEPHWVASPNMNNLCKALADGLDVHPNTEVAPLTEKTARGWPLASKQGVDLGCFDWVISTAPPTQTMTLFHRHLDAETPLAKAVLQGCYTLMVGFNKPWEKAWIAAKVKDNPLNWISINSSKPGRNDATTCMVAHTDNAWAEAHINDDMGEAQAFLVQQFEAVTGMDCSKADYLSMHRWRYANVEQSEASGPYCDVAKQLASVSDWCSQSRIEEVWLNCQALLAAMARD